MAKNKKRAAGILLPVASLPSKYGIGCFSKEAYEFVDFLEKSGASYWQILPLGPTGYGDSPYQSFSTFAGNPYFIDPESLIEKGWITKKECDAYDFGSNPGYVDYEKIYLSRFRLLQKAYKKSNIAADKGFKSFINDNKDWVCDYALYMAIKDSLGGKAWTEWDKGLKLRKKTALSDAKKKYAAEIEFYEFQQYLFYTQWMALKAYANEKGIKIIGDIPIYVAFDSADAWAGPELFQFDEDCKPAAVAGCPPDCFCETGQLWGNPLYNWEYHKKTGYAWWMKRLAYTFSLYDVVRIDHFRGFDEYYSIPFGDPTAEFGHWEKGPGFELFDTMKKTLGEKEVIAEDLGFLTPSVIKLVKKTGYPGMKIMQFAFDPENESDYMPHNHPVNSVVYTGTHDNDTSKNWFMTQAKKEKAYVKDYLNLSGNAKEKAAEALVRLTLLSPSYLAVIPLQDYMNKGAEARINTPSTLGDNWKWRAQKDELSDELAAHIRKLTGLYWRL